MMRTHDFRNRSELAGEAGFSIIEVMIVMAIVGIMATAAVISYRNALPNSRLRQATTEVFSAVNLARVSAMSQSARMTLRLTGASSTINGANVTVTGTSGTPIVLSISSSAGAAVMSQPLTTELVEITVAPGMGVPVSPQVQFNSYGLHVGGNTQLITLKNTQGTTYSINVASGGKAKWCLAAACP